MSGTGSVYSPLPQSYTDSDEYSEEELQTSSNERQRVINHITKLHSQARSEVTVSGKKPRVMNYKQLDNDRDMGITLNGFQLGSDEIAVLKSKNKIEKFSTSRKICFALSIFLCVFTTIVFLWILPCEIGSCPPPIMNSWKKILVDIELFGPISIVPNVRDKSHHNLVFLFRNSFSGENDKSKNSSERGGVITLLGGSKGVSWWVVLEREPKDIDCNVIDIDLDGWNDCLVVGRNNLLKAIQSLSGDELWNIHGNNDFPANSCDLDFPIVLPDLDGDGASDLLTICSVHVGTEKEVANSKNYFIFISGKTGVIIGKPQEISRCSAIRNLILEKEYSITYACLDSTNKESLNTMPLQNILTKADTSFEKVRLNETVRQKTQHKSYAEENIFFVQGRRLSLENQGRCPENCNMIVTIKDERNNKNNQTLWTMKSYRSYGMIPVVMEFEKLSGFVFKYWEWSEKDVQADLYETIKPKNDSSNERVFISRIRRLQDPKSLEFELFRDTLPQSIRRKRMLKKKLSNGIKPYEGSIFKKDNFKFHKIIERVVLVTFNETDVHPVIAGQSEITQICKNNINMLCQPDVRLQKHSLLIADLDRDNFQELVSYSSSFDIRQDEGSNSRELRWQLQSTVQVIRLEAELPKLFESKSQFLR